jgi:hypothetical protein
VGVPVDRDVDSLSSSSFFKKRNDSDVGFGHMHDSTSASIMHGDDESDDPNPSSAA